MTSKTRLKRVFTRSRWVS